MQDDPRPELLHRAMPEEFLPSISRWTTVGGLAVLVTLGAAVFAASILEYRITVEAPAWIRPVGEVRIVQAALGGTVESIEVEINQVVQEGDVIAYIDASRLRTRQDQLQGDIAQARENQMDAQIRALDSQVVAETDLLNRTLAAAQAELDLSERLYRDRRVITISAVQEAEAAVDFAREELESLGLPQNLWVKPSSIAA